MNNQHTSPEKDSTLQPTKHHTTLLHDLETTDDHLASPEARERIKHRQQTPGLQVPAPGASPTRNEVKHRRRVPSFYQAEAVECGAACLAMILSYYGRSTGVSEAREFCGVGRDGLSALLLVKAARAYGLEVQAVSLVENDFAGITLPAIIHWGFNHFLIVERWSAHTVTLVDPALGRRSVTAAEFDRNFTGIVLMLAPGSSFATKKRSSGRLTLRSYLARYTRIAPGAMAQILLASLFFQLFGLVIPIFTVVVIDYVIPLKMQDALLILSIGFLLVIASQGVTSLIRSCVLAYLQARIDVEMMMHFWDHLLQLPLRFFQQRSAGDLLSRFSSNLVIRDAIGNKLISTVLDGGFVLVYLLILLVISPIFALVALSMALVQVILLLATARPLRDLSRQELVAMGKAQGYLSEVLNGIISLKAAGAEARAKQRWSNLFFEQMNASTRRFSLSSLLATAMTTMGTLAPFVLLCVGTLLVLNRSMQVGTMLALNALAIAFLTPVASLVNSGQTLQMVQAHFERIADVMETKPEQADAEAESPPRLRGGIRLDGVSFRYDPNAPPILRDISLTIAPGQKIALVGRSGSGKSTLGKLLLGLYLPSSGDILYDDIPLRALKYQEVRSQFGVVMQDASILSGTIRENIAFNDPSMTMERVIKVAQIAALHRDILQMPMAYETFVSGGGSGLSGGQRQRIALARAIATAPAVLLLDEATSSLDVVTEAAVDENLRKFPCTQIIIAHRLSTVRHADQILVLDQGRIVEQGSHLELLHQGGVYARLIQSQLESGEIRK